jgi:hypothetical protein
MPSRARRNLFMSTTLMSILFAIAFKFDKSDVHWFWSDRPWVAAVLLVVGVVAGVFWGRFWGCFSRQSTV